MIRTLDSYEVGPVTVSHVEISENVDSPRGYVETACEVHCVECDEIWTHVSEADAAELVAEHQHGQDLEADDG